MCGSDIGVYTEEGIRFSFNRAALLIKAREAIEVFACAIDRFELLAALIEFDADEVVEIFGASDVF